MAVVKVTPKLLDDIKNKCAVMLAARAKTIGFDVFALAPTLYQVQEAIVWEPYAALRPIIPPEWIRVQVYLRIHAHNNEQVGYLHNGAYNIPPCCNNVSLNLETANTWGRFSHIPNLPEVQRIVMEYMEAADNRDKVYENVSTFFAKFPTVNAALKHTPEMALYLSQEVLDRVNRKVEKKEKEEIVVDIDLTSAVASAVAHRLTSGAAT